MVTTTGTAAAVIGETTMANGVGGTGTDGVIPTIMWSSSAILAFLGGGVGAGAHGQAGAGDIRTDITAMAILTTAAGVIPTMVTAMGMVMATDTAQSTSLSTVAAANPELLNCSGDCHALVITADPLTESLGHRRDVQSGRTNKTTAT